MQDVGGQDVGVPELRVVWAEPNLRLFRLKTLAGSNAVKFLLGASFSSLFFAGTLFI
jgi:hypothetical protein